MYFFIICIKQLLIYLYLLQNIFLKLKKRNLILGNNSIILCFVFQNILINCLFFISLIILVLILIFFIFLVGYSFILCIQNFYLFLCIKLYSLLLYFITFVLAFYQYFVFVIYLFLKLATKILSKYNIKLIKLIITFSYVFYNTRVQNNINYLAISILINFTYRHRYSNCFQRLIVFKQFSFLRSLDSRVACYINQDFLFILKQGFYQHFFLWDYQQATILICLYLSLSIKQKKLL